MMDLSGLLKPTEHGVEMKTLELKFTDEHSVHFTCEPIKYDLHHLSIISRSKNGKNEMVDTKKEFFLDADKLNMICDYFTGVKNDLNN